MIKRQQAGVILESLRVLIELFFIKKYQIRFSE